MGVPPPSMGSLGRHARRLLSRPFRLLLRIRHRRLLLASALIIAPALILLLVLAAPHLFKPPTPRRPPDSSDAVHIWYPPLCTTPSSFATIPAPHSSNHFPYAVLREAVVDRRPALTSFYQQRHDSSASVVRILLILSVHVSAHLSFTNSSAPLLHDTSQPLQSNLEYVLHANKFLARRQPYKPGMLTFLGYQSTVWHVGIALTASPNHPPFDFSTAPTSNLTLKISINVQNYQHEQIPYQFQLPLSCVQGWSTPGITVAPSCQKSVSEATGAALFSGSALYGLKRNDYSYYREIAHFAARALTGPIRYDLVVMSVVSPRSTSDAHVECGDNLTCRQAQYERNVELMDRVADAVEKELVTVGMPELASKILLIPTCTLGSDATNSERNQACKVSKHYGQYWATVFSYAMIAPFFKWAASYDMDEFLSPQISGVTQIPAKRADEVLEDANEAAGGNVREYGFVAQWQNFLLRNEAESRDLTKTLASGLSAEIRDFKNTSASPKCYEKLGDNTGKSVVRCDVGFGFSIHHPIMVSADKEGFLGFVQGYRMARKLRAWHARFRVSKRTCYYHPWKGRPDRIPLKADS